MFIVLSGFCLASEWSVSKKLWKYGKPAVPEML